MNVLKYTFRGKDKKIVRKNLRNEKIFVPLYQLRMRRESGSRDESFID